MTDRLEPVVIFVNFCKKFHPGWRGNFVNKTISSFGFWIQYYVSWMNCLRKLNVLCLIRGPIMVSPCRRTENRTYRFLFDVMEKDALIKKWLNWIRKKWPYLPLKVLWNLEQTSLTFEARSSIFNMKFFFSVKLLLRVSVVSWSSFTRSIVFCTAWLLIIEL